MAAILGVIFWVGIFVVFSTPVNAVTIAEQTQNYNSSLNVWQAIQELGSNLSGTAQSFTFRVSTSASNLNQFDYTGLNSRIYDKTQNTNILSCVPAGSDPNDRLRGLTFNTSGVPAGFEDVTLDFSCRNYDFIPGHRYLILITNANAAQWGGVRMRLAAATYSGSTNDYFTEGGLRYAFDNGSCNASSYIWNSQTSNSGCNIFSTTKDDLYFVLSNTSPPPPPPRLPVIFIPGIGGSEIKASQDIIWSKDDGHGGTYSHAYGANEKIWVNQDKAAELGDDDYFDVLRLKADGQTPEADLSLTGDLTSFGYSDIDSFFTGMGYTKGTNYFVFPYDWRKDVRNNRDNLDTAIETAKTASGQSQVNLVVHSMGGLIARFYISDPSKASKVNKQIELGVPHLGAVESLKTLMYGSWLGYDFRLFTIGIPPSETKDGAQNMPSIFQLIPSLKYYDFYGNSFRDDRDIDNNSVKGNLNYDQTKNLLSNLNYNMTVFGLGEQFHSNLDPVLNQTNGTKIYEIVGSAQPTLGQIIETWWITWPINLISKTDQIFINGDDTVPLYSASLKNDGLDISGATKIYYVEQKHSDLVSQNGVAMQTVKAILNDDNSLPVEVKDQKIVLEGQQISVDDADLDIYDDSNNHTGLKDNGDVETNIPNTFYDSIGKTKHIFVKKSASRVTVKVTSSTATKTKIKIRKYSQDTVSKTILYNDVSLNENTTVQFTVDPNSPDTPILSYGSQTISATTEVTGAAALDQTAPVTSISISGSQDSSGIYSGPVTVTLTGADSQSGILRIEYSLDNGQTVQIYSGPFIISTPGETTIQFKSIDNLGNEEIPQTITIKIAIPPTPTPTPTPTSSSTSSPSSSSNSTSSDSTSTTVTTSSITDPPEILGLTFENPSHISDQINVSNILDKEKNTDNSKITTGYSPKQILSGLLMASGGTAVLAAIGLILTFLKPSPK